jgi:hypothetical protein
MVYFGPPAARGGSGEQRHLRARRREGPVQLRPGPAGSGDVVAEDADDAPAHAPRARPTASTATIVRAIHRTLPAPPSGPEATRTGTIDDATGMFTS